MHSERLNETSLSDKVRSTHGSCVADLLYKFELIIINSVYSTQYRGIINSVFSTQCRVVNIQSERLIETSLSAEVGCTHSSYLASVLYKFELIVIKSVLFSPV